MAGTFKDTRGREGFNKSSDILLIEVDHVDPKEVKDKLKKTPSVAFAFG
ncbi:MAG TPA: hypothetical protein EYG49_09710 [Gammaproteobacteria bacterium]|nr:hypothetical protein [Gammaproteobacteria bacterium]